MFAFICLPPSDIIPLFERIILCKYCTQPCSSLNLQIAFDSNNSFELNFLINKLFFSKYVTVLIKVHKLLAPTLHNRILFVASIDQEVCF